MSTNVSNPGFHLGHGTSSVSQPPPPFDNPPPAMPHFNSQFHSASQVPQLASHPHPIPPPPLSQGLEQLPLPQGVPPNHPFNPMQNPALNPHQGPPQDQLSIPGQPPSLTAEQLADPNQESLVLGFTPSGKPRLHQCLVCLRSFARLEHLKRHERSHTKEKPFNCGVCGRKFSRRDLLLRHAEKLHGGCADAVKRLRRRRRSAIKKEESNRALAAAEREGAAPRAAGAEARGNKTRKIGPNGGFPDIHENGPPMSTFITEFGKKNAIQTLNKEKYDDDVNDDTNSNNDNSNTSKVRVNSLFNNFVSKSASRNPSFDNKESTHHNEEYVSSPSSKNLKRVRRASFSASSGENYAMPKYPPMASVLENGQPLSKNGNSSVMDNYLLNAPMNYFSADSVEFSTPQFVPADETDNMVPKVYGIPDLSLNSTQRASASRRGLGSIKKNPQNNNNNNNNQFGIFNMPDFAGKNNENQVDTDIKKINNIVNDLHLTNTNKQREASSATTTTENDAADQMDIDRKSSPMYGDYNIYGVESPGAEDWVNKVLEASQIEFLSNLKNGNNNSNSNSGQLQKGAQNSKSSAANDELARRISAFQNQMNKLSSDESSPYSTNVKNSPNGNANIKQEGNSQKGADNTLGSLYGYLFYSDDFYGMPSMNDENSFNKEMYQQLKSNFGLYKNKRANTKQAAVSNTATANLAASPDEKHRAMEINEEYDLISELNNLQNFQFYLNNKNNNTANRLNNQETGGVVNMHRNDSGKSTNSTQTMISSNSSSQERAFGGIAGGSNVLFNSQYQSNQNVNNNCANNTAVGNNSSNNNNNYAPASNPYFQHFNNISNGYSYYGNLNNIVTPSEISSSNSPIRNISPNVLDANNNASSIFPTRNYSQQSSSLVNSNTNPPTNPGRIMFAAAGSASASFGTGNNADTVSNKKVLFTKHLRNKIYKTLLKYPFIGIPSPTIVDNNRLNEFVTIFGNKFLKHSPFIHESFLNEANMNKLTSYYWEPHIETSPNQGKNATQTATIADEKDAASVCLPLLIATSGAIISNNKREASNLYEASRRCIHVYLDSRKKNYLTPNNSSPLWLIQSLTLSVIYGLFAEFDSSSEVILKQVNALIALIRSSGLNKAKTYEKEEAKKVGAFSPIESRLIKESKIRTVYTIFNVSNLLNYFYGLKIEKIFSNSEIDLRLPVSEHSFKTLQFSNESALNFKAVLDKLVNKEHVEEKISEYGLVSLQFALHQNLAQQLNGASVIDIGSNVNSAQSLSLLNSWHANFANQLPRHFNKNHEQFYNNSANLLKCNALILNHYLIFKYFSKDYINLNEIRYSGVWSKNWKKIGRAMLVNRGSKGFEPENNGESTAKEELQAVKFGVKILVDLFFIEEHHNHHLSRNNSSFDTNETKNDQFGASRGKSGVGSLNADGNIESIEDDAGDELFDIGLTDNMISKECISKLLSLNLQLLFDVFLVLCKFAFGFEKYCNSIDGIVINSIKSSNGTISSNNNAFNMLFESGNNGNGNSNGSSNAAILSCNIGDEGADGVSSGNEKIVGLFNNKYFIKKLKYYKLIIQIFTKLEEFCNANYSYSAHVSMRRKPTGSNGLSPSPKRTATVSSSTPFGNDQTEGQSVEDTYPRYKISLKILKIGEFFFDTIFDQEIGFNIFQNLGEGLFQLSNYLVQEIKIVEANRGNDNNAGEDEFSA